ncbi:transposase [Variovorax sp. V116]|uniref:transposase n=1 Tax=Variovorax sp. V116 TaxID=3065953 RepID=UPI0034E87847
MTSQELLAANAALSGEVQRSQEALKIALLTVEKLKVEVAYLRRMKYGRSSEQLEHAQLELVGGQIGAASIDPDAGRGRRRRRAPFQRHVHRAGSQEASGTRAHRNA